MKDIFNENFLETYLIKYAQPQLKTSIIYDRMKDIFNENFLETYLILDFTCRFIFPRNVPIHLGDLAGPKM